MAYNDTLLDDRWHCGRPAEDVLALTSVRKRSHGATELMLTDGLLFVVR